MSDCQPPASVVEAHERMVREIVAKHSPQLEAETRRLTAALAAAKESISILEIEIDQLRSQVRILERASR